MRRLKRVLATAAVLVATVIAAQSTEAQTSAKRPMTVADLMAIQRVGDPQVSANGRWVVYSATDVSLAQNTKTSHLWAVALAGGQQERQLTTGKGESNGRLAPDGKWLSYTASDAQGHSQIFVAPWNDAEGSLGAAKQLTSLETEADGAIWSPDSTRLLFTSSVYPKCSTGSTWAEESICNTVSERAAANSNVKAQLWTGLFYRHWDHYTGEKRSHVLVVSATDGNAIRDLTPAAAVGDAETPTYTVGGPLGYAWAPDSHEIAYVTNLDAVKAASTNNDVFTLRLDDPAAKAVKISTSPGSDDAPTYSPDGRYIAFRSQNRAAFESDQQRLMLYDRVAKSTKELLPTWDLWVDEMTWAPDSKALYFTSTEAGMEPIFRLPLNDLLHIDRLTEPHDNGDLHLTADGTHIVFTESGVDRPGTISTIALDHPASRLPKPDVHHFADVYINHLSYIPTVLSQQPLAQIAELALEPMEPFTFTGAENTKVHGYVLKPPHFNPAKKYPLKFLIHGGPQGAWGDGWSYRWNPELFAADGYVVVMVNPRGSTGYGQKFIDEISGDWGGKAYTDLMAGLDYAEKTYPFIDKSRECALGASYGGFMANWVLTHTTRFACIVSHDGMFNPVSAYGTTEELWFNEWEFRRSPVTGLDHWDNEPAAPWRYQDLPAGQDPFRKWSPALHIAAAKTPTLVIHSQHDYRLDLSEGLQLYDSLQRLHVPSEMLYFPDESHWVTKPQNSALWNKTVKEWCDRWTKTNQPQ